MRELFTSLDRQFLSELKIDAADQTPAQMVNHLHEELDKAYEVIRDLRGTVEAGRDRGDLWRLFFCITLVALLVVVIERLLEGLGQ
jgi:hypothetical protein